MKSVALSIDRIKGKDNVWFGWVGGLFIHDDIQLQSMHYLFGSPILGIIHFFLHFFLLSSSACSRHPFHSSSSSSKLPSISCRIS